MSQGSNFISNLCEYGRQRWATRRLPLAKVQFPEKAPTKYLPAGVYYLIKDELTTINDGKPFCGQPALAQAGHFLSLPASTKAQQHPIFTALKMDATLSDVGTFIDRCESAFDVIRTNTRWRNNEFSFEQFADWWPCKDVSIQELLDVLIAEYRIEKHPGKAGIYRVVDMTVSIREVSDGLPQSLNEVATLYEVFKIGEACLGASQLWNVPTLYLYDQATRQLRLAGRKKDGYSPYLEWASPKFLYEKVIDHYIQTGRKILIVDLKQALAANKNYIDQTSIAKDYESFLLEDGNPGQLIAGVIIYIAPADHAAYERQEISQEELRHRSVRGVWSASNRILKVDTKDVTQAQANPALRYRPPITPNAGSLFDVEELLHSLIIKPLGEKIFTILKESEGSARVLWDKEVARIKTREQINTPSQGVPLIKKNEAVVVVEASSGRIYEESDINCLSKNEKLLPDSETLKLKLRDGRRVKVEVITTNGAKEGASVWDYFVSLGKTEELEVLASDCRIVSGIASGVNKDSSVEQYLKKAKAILVARDEETHRFVGYVATQPLNIYGRYPTIFVWGNYELDSYHGAGLGTALNFAAIKVNKRMLKVSPLGRVWLCFRTWSPAAYKMIARKDVKAFPQPNRDGSAVRRPPTAQEAAIQGYIASKLLNNPLDSETGILAGVIADPAKKVDRVGVVKIDRFFNQVVRIAEGNAVLPVAKLPRSLAIIHPLREAWIKFGLVLTIPLRRLPLLKKLVKQKVEKVDWGHYFQAYDRVLLNFIPYQRLIGQLIKCLNPSTSDVIVDLGSGTGNVSVAIAEKGAKVISVDNSPEGIALHKQKSPVAEIKQMNLDMQPQDALPFADSSVDKLVASHFVNYIVNREKLYSEIRRVMKPNGTLVLAVLKKGFNPLKVLTVHMRQKFKYLRTAEKKGFFAALGEVSREFIRMNPDLQIVGKVNQIILQGATEGTYDLLTKQEIVEELEAAGFVVESIEPHYAGQDFVVKARPS